MKKFLVLMVLVLSLFTIHDSLFTVSEAGMFSSLEGQYNYDVWKYEVVTVCFPAGHFLGGYCYNEEVDTVKVFSSLSDQSSIVVGSDASGQWSQLDADKQIKQKGAFTIKAGYNFFDASGKRIANIIFQRGYLFGGQLHIYLTPLLPSGGAADPCKFAPVPAWCK